MPIYSNDQRHAYREQQIGDIKVTSMEDTLLSVSLSLTDRCTRSCDICPHGKEFVPTEPDMSLEIAETISKELESIRYRGVIGLCGYGDSLVNSDLLEICAILSKGLKNARAFELITNGDLLTPQLIQDLMSRGLSTIVVSLHDGEEQIKYFKDMFAQAEVSRYILREHWNADKMTISNRCGLMYEAPQENRPCYLPFYQVVVSSAGNVYTCSNDWTKTEIIGNVLKSSIMDIWMSDKMMNNRRRLIRGDRSIPPCDKCDIQGDCNGSASFNLFKKELNG